MPTHQIYISERSRRKKKTENKLTGLVLLHWGELKMKHSEEYNKKVCYYNKYDKYKELLPTNHTLP